jgi:hypothetical protein
VWLAAVPSLLYLIGWWAVGLASAWRAATAVRATLGASGLWMAGALFAPGLQVFVADRAVPIPSEESFQQDRQDMYADALGTAEREVGRRLGQLVSDPRATGEALERAIVAAFPRVEAQWRAGFVKARAAVLANDSARRDLHDRQERWATRIAMLLPGASLDAVLAEMVGTGASMRVAWHHAAVRFHEALQPTLFDNRPTANVRVIMGDRAALHGIPLHRPPLMGSLPEFVAPDRVSSWWERRTWALGAALLVWAALTLWLAWRAGRTALHRPAEDRQSIG